MRKSLATEQHSLRRGADVCAEHEVDQDGSFRASFSSISQWLVAAEVLGEVSAIMVSRSLVLTSGLIPDVGHFGSTTLPLGRP